MGYGRLSKRAFEWKESLEVNHTQDEQIKSGQASRREYTTGKKQHGRRKGTTGKAGGHLIYVKLQKL